MDSVLLLTSDKLSLCVRSTNGRFNQVSSIQPRDPASLRDVQVAPDGRQVLAISSNPEHGICFACFTKGQDRWLYFDYFPSEFRVTCGVFSPTRNHLVYFGTSNGGIVQFNLKTKLHTFLTKGRHGANLPVSAIDVNAVGSHVAAAVGGALLVHSLRNKIDTFIEYDTSQNAKILLRFHPTQQFVLGVFSLAEGATVMDFSSTVTQAPPPSSRWKAAVGESHTCDPCALLWAGTSALISVGVAGRVVRYSSKGCSELYRHASKISSATVFREGTEILLGLADGVGCLDLRKRELLWTKNIGTAKTVVMMSRAKPHLPVARDSSGVESMYPQTEPACPETRRRFTHFTIASATREPTTEPGGHVLISPLRGDNLFEQPVDDNKMKRRSSLGSLISPPRSSPAAAFGASTTATATVNFTSTLPSRRSATVASPNLRKPNTGTSKCGPTATEVRTRPGRVQKTDSHFLETTLKENEHHILQSTVLHADEECLQRSVDFGLDSTSPVKGARQPLSLVQPAYVAPLQTPIGARNVKSLFNNVDFTRQAAQTEQTSPLASVVGSALEKQNSLLESLVASTGRLEETMATLLEEVREQGATSRRLVEHALQLGKIHHQQTTALLVEIMEAQQEPWMDVIEQVEHNNAAASSVSDKACVRSGFI